MEVKYNIDKSTLHLYFIGELDEFASNLIRDKIDELIESVNINSLIFELKELAFADSTGIGLLLGRYKKLKKRDIAVFIKDPMPQIEKVFGMTGLFKIMPKIS